MTPSDEALVGNGNDSFVDPWSCSVTRAFQAATGRGFLPYIPIPAQSFFLCSENRRVAMEPETTSSVLEQFRQEWQQEVIARTQKDQSRPTEAERTRTRSDASGRSRPERPINKPPSKHPLADIRDEDNVVPEASTSASISERIKDLKVEEADADADEFSKLSRAEPKTALEHYERAVEKEGQGQLGDSLSHYRRAFRMDENVDKTYKEKHFANKWKLAKPERPDATTTASSVTQRPQQEARSDSVPLTTSQLISSFENCEIEGAPPLIEGDKTPPCAIKKLPTEVLLELFQHIAVKDVSIYARLASVCKKFAYHVYTENKVWKRVALGYEFGLASQKYHFDTDIQGRPIIWQALEDDDDDEKPMPQVTADLFQKDQDWREFFHSHPRIRFTGVYISTVNYTRSGGPSVTPSTWGQQVHIVTYYRYLRFFRDGTVLSLLTTHEPLEVVHLLTKENLAQVRAGGKLEPIHPLNFASAGHSLSHDRGHSNAPPIPAQNVLKHALRGRWRLCHPSLESIEIGSNAGIVGDVHIETEGGAGPRYMYTMHLSLKNGSSRQPHATKNNKLTWKGFWSFNSITGDWAEFQLRHDKAFWFSRVKSYGMGH